MTSRSVTILKDLMKKQLSSQEDDPGDLIYQFCLRFVSVFGIILKSESLQAAWL